MRERVGSAGLIACLALLAVTSGAWAKSGDIYVGDAGGGDVVRLDPKTGDQKVIVPADDPKAVQPVGGAFKGGKLYVADYDLPGVVRIDPNTKRVKVIKKDGPFEEPLDLAIGPDGKGYVAEEDGPKVGIIRVNLRTGGTKRISNGDGLDDPYALTFKGDQLLVANHATGVTQVNPRNGNTKIVCDDSDLFGTRGVAVVDGEIYANNGDNAIYRVADKHTAEVVASEGFLGGMYDMAPAPRGRLYTANTTSGMVVKVNPKNGNQDAIGAEGDINNPEGLTVQP